ncbi:ABC transporter permease/M1 family aminopeptidase [Lysobacter sp. 22409]|uniref:ABC transporter permease/M1 family aminopeptidase n=1 Tax=Lysobacter sp. 22409 TaxID=3453917 RepID=UPI003F8643F4
MIAEFFRFELRQQLRAPLLWLISLLFGLLAFAMTSSDAVQIGGAIGNVNRNAPSTVIMALSYFSLLGLFAIASFIAGALLRDFELGTADLFFSSPMRKRDFLIGRFSAALVACLLVFAMVVAGLMIAPLMPWIDPERLGPFSLMPYLWGLCVVVLPNLLFIGALLALLAVTARNLLVVYLGVIAFFILYRLGRGLATDLDNEWLAVMMDPFGITALRRTLRYWSSAELNTAIPSLDRFLLANRLVWSSIGLALAATAFALFKPQRTATGKGWFRRKKRSAPVATTPSTVVAPRVQPAFGTGTAVAQFLHALRFDTVGVLKSVPFLIMLAFAVANLLGSAGAMRSLFGTETYPTTSVMIGALQDTFGFMVVFIVMFYAGDLVFKERGVKLAEVTDAMPVPNWVPLLSKAATLVLVVLIFQGIGSLGAIGYQLAKGYRELEPLLYAKALLLDSVPFVLMGGLALVLQVLTNNKFIGYGALILVVVLQSVFGLLHFEHNLYNFSRASEAPYSDMNGYGQFLGARLWFQAYWGLFVAALLTLAAAFWVRGVSPSLRDRLALARNRLRGAPGLVLAGFALAWVGAGSFIFWNTNLLNRYVPSDVAMDEQVRYEKEYRKYKGLAQPRILAVEVDVDLHPETLSVSSKGRYRIANPHAQPISEFHITVDPEQRIAALEFGGAKLSHDDERLGYRIYKLDRPMQPGEQRELRFAQSFAQRGFGNEPDNKAIVANGSFFNSAAFPHFGYNENRQLADRNERRKRGVAEVQRMAKLEDKAARGNHYIGGDADWIDFKTTVCTAPDQIALAPGYLKREYRRDGRRCFDYAMDQPMLPFYAYLSAKWQVKRAEHGGIPVEVYYDPKHAYNVDRMIDGVKQSLDYFQAQFTPYQHRQVRIIEFPGYARFAQSFANTIPFSESIGFIADLRDTSAIDYVFYVTAHEVAHQWWAHQVIGADLQGSTMLSESLSQYSALMVMEKAYGRAKMRRFLKYELDNYLSERSAERVEELPLYRVENQPYVHYRKGSLVFYRLREDLGEAAVNRALKRFLQDKGFQQPPYTTSAELLDYLRAEAKPEQQALITDLFEKITFYDNRVVSASTNKRADGKYEVTMQLHAGKVYVDGKGKESPARLDDWIEIGVFARGPSGEEADEKPLLLERRRITEGESTIKVVVGEAPYEVGFDPYNKLIDRVSADNRQRL